MLRKLLSIIVVTTILLAVTACNTLRPQDMPQGAQISATYYTQFTLRYEKDRYRTTNYRRGALLPINSTVELVDINRKRIVVRIHATNRELLVEHVPKHTQDTIAEAFDKLFAKTEVDLSRFSKLERKGIKEGLPKKGMRKNAILAAVGYPPAIGTPLQDGDEWRYWSSRWNTFIVHFKKGRVDRIVD